MLRATRATSHGSSVLSEVTEVQVGSGPSAATLSEAAVVGLVEAAVSVEGQWPLRRELQMREEADSESDLRPPQVPRTVTMRGRG